MIARCSSAKSPSFRLSASSLLGGVLLGFASTAPAATVELMGENVVYRYDDVLNASALALLGTPTVAQDALFFTPVAFAAEATKKPTTFGYSGFDFVFEVVAKDGYVLTGGEATENGKYLTLSSASFGVITELQLVDLATGGQVSKALDVSGLGIGKTGLWEAEGVAGIAELDQAPSSDGVDAMRVTLESYLLVSNDVKPRTFSRIDANFLRFAALADVASGGVSQVPLPGAAWGFLAATIGIGATAVRRREVQSASR